MRRLTDIANFLPAQWVATFLLCVRQRRGDPSFCVGKDTPDILIGRVALNVIVKPTSAAARRCRRRRRRLAVLRRTRNKCGRDRRQHIESRRVRLRLWDEVAAGEGQKAEGGKVKTENLKYL